MDLGLCSTVQVFSLCPQEGTDGGWLSADAFKCQKHEKKIHGHACHCDNVAMPQMTLTSVRWGEILKDSRESPTMESSLFYSGEATESF